MSRRLAEIYGISSVHLYNRILPYINRKGNRLWVSDDGSGVIGDLNHSLERNGGIPLQEKKSINNVGKVPQTYDDYFRKFAERVDTCGSENDSVTSAPSSQEEDNSELSDVEFIIEQDDNQSISISHTDQSFKLSSSFTVFEGSCDGSITSEKSTDEQDQDNDITLISDDSSEEVTMVTEEEEEESENEAELPCQPICSPDSQGMELILGSENDKDNEEDGIRNEDESNEKDGEGKEDRGSEKDGGSRKV
ncbi:hypothetical protein FSP39_012648 [Pinctada imbricata]|uniref:Uncharacterized protein n=1 Tax=Pinctada imbricata TaxID=66713 RepID=A0AA89BR45_PINIB|nr:hypothetical protein FSP39_012648 [Pinctada imbricata]